MLLNNRAFDIYSPAKNTSARNISSTVLNKAENQADRIVVNLDNSIRTPHELRVQFNTWGGGNAKEILALKNGIIYHIIFMIKQINKRGCYGRLLRVIF